MSLDDATVDYEIDEEEAIEKIIPLLRQEYDIGCDDGEVDHVDEDIPLGKYVQWSTSDHKRFIPTCYTQKELAPGYYEVRCSNELGIYFERVEVNSEALLRLPDSNSDKVVSEIEKFWEREHIFREYGLAFKRGMLLYGPPGSGKSCTIRLVCADVIKRGGLCLKFTDPDLLVTGIRILRDIQPGVPVVVLMEDIDALFDNRGSRSDVLNLLDGVTKLDKIVFLATTNYPEKLEPRVKNRPSRFDKRFKIDTPNEVARRMYFEHLIGDHKVEGVDIDRWVKDSDTMTLAHLKEIFIAVVILGDDYEETIETLHKMKDPISSDEDHRTGAVGFGATKRIRAMTNPSGCSSG